MTVKQHTEFEFICDLCTWHSPHHRTLSIAAFVGADHMSSQHPGWIAEREREAVRSMGECAGCRHAFEHHSRAIGRPDLASDSACSICECKRYEVGL